MPDLATVRETRIDPLEDVEAIACADIHGRTVYGAQRSSPVDYRLAQLDSQGAWSGVWNGRTDGLRLYTTGNSTFALWATPAGGGLLELAPAPGTERHFDDATRPVTAAAISPSRDAVTVVHSVKPAADGGGTGAVAVLGPDGSWHETPLAQVRTPASVLWADDSSLTVTGDAGDGNRWVETYDRSLKLRSKWSGWPALGAVISDGRLYGLTDDGMLVAADPTGPEAWEVAEVGRAMSFLAVPPLDADTARAIESGDAATAAAPQDRPRSRQWSPVAGVFVVLVLVGLVCGRAVVRPRRGRTEGSG